MIRDHDPRGGCIRKPGCKPYWYAQRTYTAECPTGMTGGSVTRRANAISYISLQDAQRKALADAKAQAEAALTCCWKERACVQHTEDFTIATVESNFQGDLTVSYTTEPPLIPNEGQAVVLVLPDTSTIPANVTGVSGTTTIQIDVDPGFSLPVGTEVVTKPLVCCEVCSTISRDDALERARECAEEQQYHLQYHGDLLPIGHYFLS